MGNASEDKTMEQVGVDQAAFGGQIWVAKGPELSGEPADVCSAPVNKPRDEPHFNL